MHDRDEVADPTASSRPASGAWLAVVLVVAVVAIGGLLLTVERGGPDVSVTGRVTSIALHELCIDEGGGHARCFQMTSPNPSDGISVDDCVTVHASAEHMLMALVRSDGCGR